MTGHDPFSIRLQRVFNRVERMLLRLIVGAAFLLVLVQLLLLVEPVRDVLVETVRLEGRAAQP